MTPTTLFELNGKTALVTGGATGIGRMATTALAAAGHGFSSRHGKSMPVVRLLMKSIAWVLQAVCMPCRGMSQQKMALSN